MASKIGTRGGEARCFHQSQFQESQHLWRGGDLLTRADCPEERGGGVSLLLRPSELREWPLADGQGNA